MECLTALLKDVGNIHAFGQLLGIAESTLAAIESYYKQKELKISHMVSQLLIKYPDDPVTQLRDALNALEKYDISQTLVLLASLGKTPFRNCSNDRSEYVVICYTGENLEQVTEHYSMCEVEISIKEEDFSWKGC